MPLRILIIATTLFSLFALPWQVTVVLLLVAALVFPPAGILLGLLAEIFYWAPGFIPYYALAGAVATGGALLVHRFIKTRIMDT